MNGEMRAVMLDAPGPAEALQVRNVPIPEPSAGWVLIAVRAFGLNRSELHLRAGVAHDASFPRIPGIEAAGVVVKAPGGEYAPGTSVVTMMGGMGRSFDGGYAQYVLVPAGQVIPIRAEVAWEVVGALPEMLQTAYGALTIGAGVHSGDYVLIRGGTSSVGLMAIRLAKRLGATAIATTRQPARVGVLEAAGADHVIVDDGEIAPLVREIVPGGADAAVELVGVNVLKDTLRSVRSGGTVAFAGMLSDQWTIDEFYPLDWLPNGVRLTGYSGQAQDLPADVLQSVLDDIAAGRFEVPIGRVYALDEIVQAHRDLEAGTHPGKLVVVP